MSLEKLANKVVDTDVLVIGGGISGCPAAWKAAEHGVRVTLLEKSKPERSGDASHGIDEIQWFARDGLTTLDIVRNFMGIKAGGSKLGEGRHRDPNIIYKCVDNSLWAVEELDRAGVTMRWDDGEYYWFPKSPEYKNRICLRVHWMNVKPEMARAVRKAGVEVIERTMMVDLLTHDGRVVGATAVNTRTGEFIVIKAKAVVLATSKALRHYNSETPQSWRYKMRYHLCPTSLSGDGHAAAYRAGAALLSMEQKIPFHLLDDITMAYRGLGGSDGIRSRIFTWEGREISGIPKAEYHKLEEMGLDPFYQSIEHLHEDFLRRVDAHCADDNLISLKLAEERGFNPRTHWFQATWNNPTMPLGGNLRIGEDFQTEVEGLFIVGDMVLGSYNWSATTGMLVGNNIDRFISGAKEPYINEDQVESQKETALAPLLVKDGVEPMELESSIREICGSYCGMVIRSEGRIREGLRRLGSLRKVFLPKLMASNPHYLMRCLEVRNILLMAELHMQASLERRETRGVFQRLDYLERDPSHDNKVILQHLVNEKPALEFWEVPELKPEYARAAK
jgi:succinate dehydrogenase/fumarate reductase flavoprotein subunit